ncbi:MAG: FAD-binding oxidoreductase [Thermomicrobiales bacterium]|nr:FAD-binding oxidoreductase [Thermomicrobiales bacterium]
MMQNSNGYRPSSRVRSIAGVTAGEVAEPSTPAEVAESLATAVAQGSGVIPVGGGTHLGIGNAPARADVVLSTRKLDRILVYEPADMTLSVEAGATLQHVQETLAERGQGMPIEVSNPVSATIGGILATALYGPKRLGWGTLRDYLIGIAVAYPDGTVGKAGGLVVKNVSGFDLMRMHHGALGTLGVIVSANFKVLPAPRSERTVLLESVEMSALPVIREACLNWRGKVAAFQIDKQNESASVAIRIDGRDRTAELLATELAGRIAETSSILDPDASRSFWSSYVARFDAGNDPASWWLRCHVQPSQSLGLFAQLCRLPELAGAAISTAPGLGYVDIRGDDGNADSLDRVLKTVRALCPRTRVVAMPESTRRDHDVWGDSVDSVDLMRQLKQEFDPERILNPGRFVGGL